MTEATEKILLQILTTLKVASEMRKAQKQYFSTRSPSWLSKAKRLESTFDTQVAELRRDGIELESVEG